MTQHSFSYTTKQELCAIPHDKICCSFAELLGITLLAGRLSRASVKIVTENMYVADRAADLFKIVFDVETKFVDTHGRPQDHGRTQDPPLPEITDKAEIEQILLNFKLITIENKNLIKYRVSLDFLRDECCRAAFLRGVFLGGGTVGSPQKSYQLEIFTHYFGLADDLQKFAAGLDLNFKRVTHKGGQLLYIKESEQIIDMLTFTGAVNASMELMNVKIEKEIRNDLNRAVNAENANLDKTINASMRLLLDIKKIEETIGISALPQELSEVAKIRKRRTDLSIAGIGKLLTPPLSKSGVSHRLKKISEIARGL